MASIVSKLAKGDASIVLSELVTLADLKARSIINKQIRLVAGL